MDIIHNRKHLISQVKAEYARLADLESQENYVGGAAGTIPPQVYYERLLDQVLAAIEFGRFDACSSGREVVEQVTCNRAQWGIG